MTHLSLMLAARATAAVPGMVVVSSSDISDERRYGALLTDSESRAWLVELPRMDDEEVEQRERIPALRAIGDGLRSRLPFGVPRIHGESNVRGRTLTVAEWLPGSRTSIDKLSPAIAGAIGEALGALHGVPSSALYDTGRSITTANEAQRLAVGIVDRAAGTTLLPQSLLRRWEAAYEDPELWQFEPTIVHGSLRLDHFLVEGARVTAITGWRSLHVGDPARDIAWTTAPAMKGRGHEVENAYRTARPSADKRLFQRGRFWAELEIARWLLHGMEIQDNEIIEDATVLINELHDRVGHDLDSALTEPITQTPHPLYRPATQGE